MVPFLVFPAIRLVTFGLACVGGVSLIKGSKPVPERQSTPAPAPVALVPAGGYFKLEGLPCNNCHEPTGFSVPAPAGMQLLCGKCSEEV